MIVEIFLLKTVISMSPQRFSFIFSQILAHVGLYVGLVAYTAIGAKVRRDKKYFISTLKNIIYHIF